MLKNGKKYPMQNIDKEVFRFLIAQADSMPLEQVGETYLNNRLEKIKKTVEFNSPNITKESGSDKKTKASIKDYVNSFFQQEKCIKMEERIFERWRKEERRRMQTNNLYNMDL